MEVKYQIFKTDQLLIQKFFGLFSLEDYVSYNRYIGKYLSMHSIKRVLIDFRELSFWENNGEMPVDFYEKLDSIVEVRRNISQQKPSNKEVHIIILVEKPLPTVIAHLFVDKFSGMNYNYCSTTEKAIELLKIPDYSNKLESLIKTLENTYKRS